ncbi:hypothetical protein FISHEDRAFT_54820 [Fistulina hepatica ATCC 64428]|uniref:Uncharacterized protein n=1 Tax=Fistulina hepatica ATCC 64428 TaxID=1128425 RepID=A0A0D7AT72_9AGAR|nr:hypothetical protein FISHEDRAFT_54820 [Fistulina hepatica ATCC 64428]
MPESRPPDPGDTAVDRSHSGIVVRIDTIDSNSPPRPTKVFSETDESRTYARFILSWIPEKLSVRVFPLSKEPIYCGPVRVANLCVASRLDVPDGNAYDILRTFFHLKMHNDSGADIILHALKRTLIDVDPLHCGTNVGDVKLLGS